MKPYRRLAAGLLALVIGCGVLLALRVGARGVEAEEGAVSAMGRVRAPEFSADVPWLNAAEPVRLADLRGKVVLLDFWTYCCINCMHVLPELAVLEQRFPEELVVLGIHSAKFTDEGEIGNIRSAVLRYGIEHPVAVDTGMRVWNEYAVRAWPTLILIDAQGRVIGRRSGEITADEFAPFVAEAVAEGRRDGSLHPSPANWRLERSKEAPTLLSFPSKVLTDEASDRLFIADTGHHRLLISSLTGQVQRAIGEGTAGLVDGDYATARFNTPQGMAVVGDRLYVADTQNHALRVVDLQAERVTTLVGTGTKPEGYNLPGAGRSVALHSPWAVAEHGGRLYVANAGSHQIWQVDPASGQAEPFAGSAREDLRDGPAAAAALAQPSALAVVKDRLYFVDSETSSVRWVGLVKQPDVRTLIGHGLFDFGDVDGDRQRAKLQHPLGLAATADGLLYVADTYNNKVKRLDLATGQIAAFAGSGDEGARDGAGWQATFDEPGGLSIAGGRLYVADTNNHAIRVLDLATAQVSTLTLSEPHLALPPTKLAEPLLTLPAAQAGDGGLKLRLTVRPPAGSELTAGVTPDLRVDLGAGPRRVSLAPADGGWLGTVDVGREAAEAIIEATAYVCDEGGGGACRLLSAAWRLPLQRMDGVAPGQVELAMPNPPS